MDNELTAREHLWLIIRRNDGTVAKAATKIGCTRQYLGTILGGGYAGCRLAKRIENYTDGAVKQSELICGD